MRACHVVLAAPALAEVVAGRQALRCVSFRFFLSDQPRFHVPEKFVGPVLHGNRLLIFLVRVGTKICGLYRGGTAVCFLVVAQCVLHGLEDQVDVLFMHFHT